ncbi:MAG: lipocalin-like domain-containing protein [Thermoanaerobaculia bacterium]
MRARTALKVLARALAVAGAAALSLFTFKEIFGSPARIDDTKTPGGRFKPLDPNEKISFPRDHGAHEDSRVEWWYVTGQLETSSGKRLGYQLTFFRTGITDDPAPRASSFAARDLHLAHFARTDVSKGTFRFAERLHRDGPGAAYARAGRLSVANEDWRLEEVGGRLVLFAKDGGDELSLVLSPEKPPVLHGQNGMSRKGSAPEAVSRYVSLTRLSAAGWWTTGGTSEAVAGLSWFDHEWGSGSIGKETRGWDWFAVHLLDGRDLMLYRLRGAAGNGTPFSSGTLVERDGAAVPLAAADFTIEETARWKSPASGATYPARWVLRVPKAGIGIEVVPVLAGQELATEKSTRVTYWEGACDAMTLAGAPAGRAYVEMTGYAGTGGLGLFR